MELAEISKIGASPIPGEKPAGIDALFEPEYEKVQAEVGKLEGISGANDVPVLRLVDWKAVVEGCAAVLSGKSKDLRLCGYLAVGLFQTQGYPGLLTGLGVLEDVMGSFWQDLFPPVAKVKGRKGAILWLDANLPRALALAQPSLERDREMLEKLKALAERLGAAIREKLPSDESLTKGLESAVAEKLAAIPPPPSAAAPAEAAPPPEAVGQTAPPAEIDSPDRAREAVLKAVAFLRQASPADPIPYALLRALLWADLDAAPEDEGGQTSLPGGDAALPAAWDTALKRREFARVAEEVETRLPNDRLWLDLHLYAVRALEGLGEAYGAARRAVIGQVAGLLRRIPGLSALRFEGGVPFAGDATRVWIENEVLGPASAAGASSRTAPDELEAAVASARQLVVRKKLQEALELLQKGMRSAPQGRRRFLWRLAMAKACAEAGRRDLALHQLEPLDEEARKLGLDDWEPELALEVVKTMLTCCNMQGDGRSGVVDGLLARLSRLDVNEALAIDRKK